MFKTKAEVDRHVDNSLKKTTSESERNVRCYAFAKLYFNVGDFEQTRRYVSSYLSSKPKSPEGYLLLGKALEKLGKKEAALEAYRTSLQLDPKQNNLVIKVCELLSSDEVGLDEGSARYYCELGQSLDPQNPAVYTLKERLIQTDDNPGNVSKLLLKELENRPKDVNLRVKLLKHFLQNGNVKEAYKHASDVEKTHYERFHGNLNWYETLAAVLVRYQADYAGNLNWNFYCLTVGVLERLVCLSLDENSEIVKPASEYVTAVFNFDQILYKNVKFLTECPDRQLGNAFLSHYQAQLYWHLAVLLLKQAKKDLIPFKEAGNLSLPLLLVAYHTLPVEVNSLWFNQLDDVNKKLILKWNQEGNYRCSQAGHLLLSAFKERKSLILEKATQFSAGLWKEQLFKKMFVKREFLSKLETSCFVNSSNEPVIKLPAKEDLSKFDGEFKAESLHQNIWLAMNCSLCEFSLSKTFEGLQFSVKNLSNCGAETLNLLDLQTFIFCATLCAKAKLDESKNYLYFNQDKPALLPVAITESLGTIQQAKFWKFCVKIYKNDPEISGEMRLVLIKTIEVLRCIGSHGLDVRLLVKLANLFADFTKTLSKQSEIEACEARAELFWKTALPLLEKLKNNQMLTYPNNRLFDFKSKDLSNSELINLLEKGKLYIAIQLMKRKDYEKALHEFEPLKDPYASFYQAQIYKHMADHKTHQNKENVTSEMRSQNITLLSRARDFLYLTLDRLRDPTVDKNHALNSQLGVEIEKIERLLSRIDPDCTNRNECDGMSDVSTDSAEHYLTSYTTHHASFANGMHTPKHEPHPHSTPYRFDLSRREARPSPERLDAQIRQLAASKDVALQSVLEQNKIMVESQRSLLDELRSFKDAVNNLTSTVEDLKSMKKGFEELKQVKKSVDELKNSVDDLQSVVDLVQEMKKEINDLKKDSKNNQLSEEDLYAFDPDYAVDYNVNSNLNYANPGLYSTGYPQGPNRSLGFNPAAAAGLYSGLYPPMAAAAYYGGLGLNQPFVNDQQMAAAVVAAASLPQPFSSLPTPAQPNLNLNLLTGRTLSQSQDPKAALSTFTSTTQSVFPSMSSSVISKAPVNVVITASDPLPTKTPVSQPVLSVTVPPQHIKGGVTNKTTPHNYQIPLSVAPITTAPAILSTPCPAISTQSLLSNVAPPIFSAVSQNKTPTKNSSLSGLEASPSGASPNVSSTSIEEYDPIPDYKPIIPLPDEVPTITGEEQETVLFEERAKLYRYDHDVKQWKDRGIGAIKILQNTVTNKVRVLMRRDQTHKVCANHFITQNVTLNASEHGFTWKAHDFADEVAVWETLRVRFKTPDQSKKFEEVFNKAKLRLDEPKGVASAKTTASSLGGFVFTTTPTFQPKEPIKVVEIKTPEKTKEEAKPFSTFSFGTPTFGTPTTISSFKPIISQTPTTPSAASNNDDESVAEFVPTAEFKPVVALPDLVDVKTGEENAEVLFEASIKLFRLDTSGETKEWKERGRGIIKVLKEDTVRLVMRREQVHKVCCNHQLLKPMKFNVAEKNKKMVLWAAQDFSDNVLNNVTFNALFKTPELAEDFVKVLSNAQASLDDNNCVSTKKPSKVEPSQKATPSFGDKFKPAKGSWECINCYIVNDSKNNHCVACETPKKDQVPPKTQPSNQSAPVFSFGIKEPVKVTATTKSSSSWGDAFKPAPGSWACQACYTSNKSDATKCVSCETNKDGSVSDSNTKKGGVNLETPGVKFSFGIPTEAAATPPTVTKATVQFSFGQTTISTAPTFSFGESKSFSFTPKTILKPTSVEPEKFVFGSPQAHPFEFTPRSPRKSSGGQEEESDGSYVEEEPDNIYFKPIIPLPNKIEVKTGEEDSEVVYEHRAKLFRHVDGDWKERGLGDIKILRQIDNGKLRVVMRRQQVLKLCLNHALTKDIVYQSKDDKSWLFSAADYSEGALQRETFCVRFKTPEVALDFMKAVNGALDGELPSKTEEPKGVIITEIDDSDEVEFVSETHVTKAEEEEAIKLGLPAKYFAYRQLEDCACEQCKKDDLYYAQSTPKSITTFSFSTRDGDTLKDLLRKPKLNMGVAAATPTTTSSAMSSFSFSANTPAMFGGAKLFGPSSATSGGSLFATPSLGGTSPVIFGGGKATPNTPTAATLPQSTTSIFGSVAQSTTPLFGGAALNTTPVSSTGSIFGGPTPQTPPFNTSNSIFGGLAPQTTPLKTTELTENDESILKTTSTVTFGSLAKSSGASTNEAGSFSFLAAATPTNFSFLNSGAPVFGRQLKKANASENEDSVDDNYDPHYEPIVPLPEEINVVTGEEDETVVFAERAKLYRFADKEWKERGVGVLKILYHPKNGTYRMLLRRDKVHKVVLNQLVTADLDVQPQKMNLKAFLWAGINFTEDGQQLEKLCATFKTPEIAKSFFNNIQSTVCRVIEIQNVRAAEGDAETEEDVYEDVSDDHEDDGSDDEVEEDDNATLFTRSCTFSEEFNGKLQQVNNCLVSVLCNQDSYTICISVVAPDGEELCTTLVTANVLMDINGKECSWYYTNKNKDQGVRKAKVTFLTEKDACEFHGQYFEGVNYAREIAAEEEQDAYQ